MVCTAHRSRQAAQSGFTARVAEAEHARQQIESAVTEFLAGGNDGYDILVMPCVGQPPFDKELRYPETLGTVRAGSCNERPRCSR